VDFIETVDAIVDFVDTVATSCSLGALEILFGDLAFLQVLRNAKLKGHLWWFCTF
jgi:hypothetical protein